MHIKKSDRSKVINELEIPQSIKDLLLNKQDYEVFNDYFKQPQYFYSQGWPDKEADWPELEKFSLLALWEASEKVYAQDLKTNKILSFYIEYPEEYEIIENIYLGILEIIDFHVWECGGDEQEAKEAIKFIETISFPFCSDLKEILENHRECTEEQLNEIKKKLITRKRS